MRPLWALALATVGALAPAAHARCNLSALTGPMLLHSGTNLNALGNYDGCQGLAGAHHCVFAFEIPPKHLPANQTFWLNGAAATLGVCLPASCTAHDAQVAADSVLHAVNPNFWRVLGPDVARLLQTTRLEVTCAEDRLALSHDPIACVMLALSGALLVLVLAATVWEWAGDAGQGPRRGSLDPTRGPPATARLAAAFSLGRNGRDLLAHRSTNTDFLNGLRVLSIAWVVLGHIAIFTKPGWSNVSVAETVLDNYAMALVFGAFFAVDTFFFMSGFLQAFVMPPYLLRLRSWPLHGLPLVYLLRWLRITPLLLFVIFALRVTRYAGEGPLFYHYQRSAEWRHCEQYWWTTVLYINDLYPDRSQLCLGWSWYLSNDWQFFLLTGPLLLWYTYGTKAQVVIFLAVVLAASMTLGARGQLSALNDAYFHPWNRCAPYAWGVLAALLLQRLKDQPPPPLPNPTLQAAADFGGDTDADVPDSTPFFVEERPPRWLQAALAAAHTAWSRRLGYLGALLLMWGGITLTWAKYKAEWGMLYGRPTPHAWAPVYNHLYGAAYSFSWGLALALIVVPWGLGYGGGVREALGHPLFTPLARLTYGVYLVHPFLILYTTWQARSYPTWTTAEVALAFLGQLALATLASVVLFLVVEKPVANLVALLAPEKKGGSG